MYYLIGSIIFIDIFDNSIKNYMNKRTLSNCFDNRREVQKITFFAVDSGKYWNGKQADKPISLEAKEGGEEKWLWALKYPQKNIMA